MSARGLDITSSQPREESNHEMSMEDTRRLFARIFRNEPLLRCQHCGKRYAQGWAPHGYVTVCGESHARPCPSDPRW